MSSGRSTRAHLADSVMGARGLPVVPSPVLSGRPEVLHGDGGAFGWRYQAVDVMYEEQRVVAVGGPFMFGVTAATGAIGNRRVRAEAQRLAAPQWRPLGHLRILATNHRLLVCHEGTWESVWYEAMRLVRPALPDLRLELLFEDDPPYALHGPWVPYLGTVLATAFADRSDPDSVAIGGPVCLTGLVIDSTPARRGCCDDRQSRRPVVRDAWASRGPGGVCR